KPLPMGAMAFLGMLMLCVTNTLSVPVALTAFSSSSVWLIVMAFFIARGFIVTGLGRRLALHFLSIFGKHPLGLGYGIVMSDLLMAPAIPSSTARCGGVILPIVRGIADSLDSRPGDSSSRRIGAFLNLTAFHTTVISSTMFVTAMAANPLAMQLCCDAGYPVSWGKWAIAGLLPGIISLIVLPPLLWVLHPPELRDTKEAAASAKQQLADLGGFSLSESILMATFGLMLVLWIAGPAWGVDPALAAMVGLGLLLISKVLTWDQIKSETGAWDTLMWFAILVMMAGQMNKLGLMTSLGAAVSDTVGGLSWPMALALLGALYYYIHYLFASNTAHVSALFAPFFVILMSCGVPPMLAALSLCFLSALNGGLTHYSCGHAPLLFAAGYVDLATWWKIGAAVSTVLLAIWMLVGPVWWHVLGYW
ncbi:MAG: DASS family sodium-coupled anion symporter, partial [Chlamydiia bacterium]|nr:DASS family sodium-coupled anion symporter [Chlamydiia bacterium]